MRRSTHLLALVALCIAPPAAPSKPAPHKGAFYTGIYPNLFLAAGHTQPEIDARIAAAYTQLFHGNPDTESIYIPAGHNDHGNLAYILDVGDNDVRSEGISYGLMIAVQLNHRADFDALWNWARTYMYIADPLHPSFGYYAWSCKPTGEQNSDTSAPDGEEYFAMALYFASARWGDGQGIYNYHARADEILRTILHRKRSTGHTRFGDRDVAAAFSEDRHMVRFLPEPGGRDFTDPSYHLPAFYELWSRWGPPEDRPFWAETARTSRTFFLKTANPQTALSPVYANFDGSPHATGFTESTDFGHDAWRVAANWSVDFAWFSPTHDEQALSDRLQTFFAAQPQPYGQVFTLEGKPLVAYPATGLIASNAVASLAATPSPQSSLFVDALWNAPIPTGHWRYYDGLLYLLSLLHVSGQFKIWPPLEKQSILKI